MLIVVSLQNQMALFFKPLIDLLDNLTSNLSTFPNTAAPSQKTARPAKNGESKNTGVEQAVTAIGRRGMDTLERRIAPGAFHNSGEIFEPPKCQSKNRTDILYADKERDGFNVVPMTTDGKLDSSVVRRDRKRNSNSMIQAKEVTISGSEIINVEGDYHEHNTTYVIEEAPAYRGYLETIKDGFKNLETKINNLFMSSPKEDNVKCDDSSRQTMHSPSRVGNENMGDTSSSDHVTEIRFNSLNDPPQSTSALDDEYCIYQTPTPSRINDFTPSSRTFSGMAQDVRNLPSGNQHPYPPFGYMVPGIVHYSPCWLPSWGGWIASWISWISPPYILWPSFL